MSNPNERILLKFTSEEWKIIDYMAYVRGKKNRISLLNHEMRIIASKVDDFDKRILSPAECIKEAQNLQIPEDAYPKIIFLSELFGTTPARLVTRLIVDPILYSFFRHYGY